MVSLMFGSRCGGILWIFGLVQLCIFRYCVDCALLIRYAFILVPGLDVILWDVNPVCGSFFLNPVCGKFFVLYKTA